MSRKTGFSGIAGITVLAFGIGLYLIAGEVGDKLSLIHILIGAVMLLFWMFRAGLSGMRDAGNQVLGSDAGLSLGVLLSISFFLVLLIGINWIAWREDVRWDLTESHMHTLADQSQRVMDQLEHPLELVLVEEQSSRRHHKNRSLLELYRRENTKLVDVQSVNPASQPNVIDQLQLKSGHRVYLKYGPQDSASISRLNILSEEALTEAILKVVRGQPEKIYLITGHGEPQLSSQQEGGLAEFAAALQDEHFRAEELLLTDVQQIPEEAALLILAAPEKELLEQELQMIIQYLENGGSALLLHDPRTSAGVPKIAAHFGVEVGSDLIFDKVQRPFGDPQVAALAIVTDYAFHPVTKSFRKDTRTIFHQAASVTIGREAQEGELYTPLARTSASAWGEQNLKLVFDSEKPFASRDPSDIQGPVPVALAYERTVQRADEPVTTKMVVVGDSDWIQNGNLGIVFNRDLALNIVNWLSGFEANIAIRPRTMRASLAPISYNTYLFVFVGSFVVPELFLLIGLLVWWKRKSFSVA